MSMYRQLWLALILSTLLALIGSLLASTFSARSYLQEQLRIKNSDNATALALSLSQKKPDAVETELAVAALFDSGHYEAIRVVDPNGKLIVQRMAQDKRHETPQWFIKMLPIAAPPGIAQISNGWNQVGTVSLSSDNRFAYRSLWNSTLQMAAVLMFAGLVGGYLGTLILRRLKKPLDSVIEQARAITERRFIITSEPDVPELRQLSSAMNFAVNRLKSMFEEEAGRLEALRRDANCDSLTGLANRDYFMSRLRAIAHDDLGAGGSLMLIRLAYLAETNRRLGRTVTDELLKTFAKTVDQYAQRFPEGMAARLNGADFAIVLPNQQQPLSIAEELLHRLVSVTSPFLDHQAVAFIGTGYFSAGAEPGAILAQVDGALASVEAKGSSGVLEAPLSQNISSPASSEEWSRIIRTSLDQGWITLASFPVCDLSGKLLNQECPLRMKFSQSGEWQPAGQFLPAAERLGLTSALDLTAIELGLQMLEKNESLPSLAINLSAQSVQDSSFRTKLRHLLKSHGSVARKLWLEVNEHGALAHLNAFRNLCEELAASGCRIGIEHFGRQFSEIGRFHELGLHYLKVDASFIRNIDTNAGNQAFLKGLASIGHGIGFQVYAEGVSTSAELQTLRGLGFDGATGPVIKNEI